MEETPAEVATTTPETYEAAFARLAGAAKKQHGKIMWVGTDLGRALFRRPSEREVLAWSAQSDQYLKAQALATMCQECFVGVVHTEPNGPTTLRTGPVEFARVLEEEGPAFCIVGAGMGSVGAMNAAGVVLILAGYRKRETAFL